MRRGRRRRHRPRTGWRHRPRGRGGAIGPGRAEAGSPLTGPAGGNSPGLVSGQVAGGGRPGAILSRRRGLPVGGMKWGAQRARSGSFCGQLRALRRAGTERWTETVRRGDRPVPRQLLRDSGDDLQRQKETDSPHSVTGRARRPPVPADRSWRQCDPGDSRGGCLRPSRRSPPQDGGLLPAGECLLHGVAISPYALELSALPVLPHRVIAGRPQRGGYLGGTSRVGDRELRLGVAW
jgi:hypothetical protein